MTLTTSQFATLKAYALADPTAANFITNGNDPQLAEWFNAPSTKIVWRSLVPVSEVGQSFEATELNGLTSLNNDRLGTFALWNPAGATPARVDHRAFFSSIFSGAGGATTRGRLDTLWRRFATRAEAALATGTGTTQDPAVLVWEGTLSTNDSIPIRNA